METGNTIALPGSERRPTASGEPGLPVSPERELEITVVLKPRPEHRSGASFASRSEFAARHGSSESDLARVEVFARACGLSVRAVQPGRRSVQLRGTVRDLELAFAVKLHQQQSEQGTFVVRDGSIHIPSDLVDVIDGVFGLDTRPQAVPRFRYADPAAIAHPRSISSSYTPVELAQLYRFPEGFDGSGQCIALIELGGGYRHSDLESYFQDLGIPLPSIHAVSVDGARNSPTGDPDGPDGEVLLDLQVAGAAAPGARLVVYFASNTDRGFINAVATAIHDQKHQPSSISISWGSPEILWTGQALRVMDALFADAGRMGITVACASGDAGSSDGLHGAGPVVDFPAASPHALACGGTRLRRGPEGPTETAWHDRGGGATGGGVSRVFVMPAWQASAQPPPRPDRDWHGRGVPDVSANADPETGYRVLVDGQERVVGGTSAVAPLWCALVARLNQALGTHLGFLNPRLYAELRVGLRDVIDGDNGEYRAHLGWDPCTGLGTPDGVRLLEALRTQAVEATASADSAALAAANLATGTLYGEQDT